MKITNHNVYDLENAIRASKYPMASDVTTKDCEITDRVRSLGKTKRRSWKDDHYGKSRRRSCNAGKEKEGNKPQSTKTSRNTFSR